MATGYNVDTTMATHRTKQTERRNGCRIITAGITIALVPHIARALVEQISKADAEKSGMVKQIYCLLTSVLQRRPYGFI